MKEHSTKQKIEIKRLEEQIKEKNKVEPIDVKPYRIINKNENR